MLSATYAVRKVTDISLSFLHQQHIQGLLLDIDNTLTTHDNPHPGTGVMEWLHTLQTEKIHLMLVSNNRAPRVAPFAELLGVPFVCDGKKPLSRGFCEAVERLRLPKASLCAVGDQLYTDILGANIFGIRSIYVSPIALEGTTFFRLKRALEKPFLPKQFLDE